MLDTGKPVIKRLKILRLSNFVKPFLMSKRKPSIEVYLSDDQKVIIKKAAADSRLSISEYCVEMIFKGQIHAPLSPIELKLMVDLSGMANNLNQAMKRVNQEKDSNERLSELQQIIDKIGQLLK